MGGWLVPRNEEYRIIEAVPMHHAQRGSFRIRGQYHVNLESAEGELLFAGIYKISICEWAKHLADCSIRLQVFPADWVMTRKEGKLMHRSISSENCPSGLTNPLVNL